MMTWTRELENIKALTKDAYEPGELVTVLIQYQGSGNYRHDGYEGEWYVEKQIGPDLYLTRYPGDRWEVCIHRQRIKGDRLSYWHRDSLETATECSMCRRRHGREIVHACE